MSEPVRGWAIKGPDGLIVANTVTNYEESAWKSMGVVSIGELLRAIRKGYRAVQVEFREVEDGL